MEKEEKVIAHNNRLQRTRKNRAAEARRSTAIYEIARMETRYSMNSRARIRNCTIGVIIGLVVSVWWIFMGLDIGFRFEASDAVSHWLTLGGYRHTIMTILALILIPVCALEKRWGFLAAIVLGVATLTLAVVHVIYMLITAPSGYESQLFGPIIWSVMQIPIIVFSHRAGREPAKDAGTESGV